MDAAREEAERGAASRKCGKDAAATIAAPERSHQNQRVGAPTDLLCSLRSDKSHGCAPGSHSPTNEVAIVLYLNILRRGPIPRKYFTKTCSFLASYVEIDRNEGASLCT